MFTRQTLRMLGRLTLNDLPGKHPDTWLCNATALVIGICMVVVVGVVGTTTALLVS